MAIDNLDLEILASQENGDLGVWGSKEKIRDKATQDKVNELVQSSNDMNDLTNGKLDRGGYLNTAQDLKDEIDLKQNIADNGLNTSVKTIVGAINEHEAQINQNIADINSLESNKLEKGGYTGTANDLNTAIQNIGDGSPKGAYATLLDLQTAFPTGTTGIYIVTADGNWYFWNGSAWTSGGIYQATGIANNSLTVEKFKNKSIPERLNSFLNIATVNLFNKNTVLSGYNIDANGVIIPNTSWSVSDYIKVLPSTQYTRKQPYRYVFYDDNYNFISSTWTTKTITTPSNCEFIRLAIFNTQIKYEQLELGAVSTTLVQYKVEFPTLYIPPNELDFFDTYPFQTYATLNNDTDKLIIKKAIKKVEIFNANPNKKYALGILQRNYSTYGTGIYIAQCNEDGSFEKYVCSFVDVGYIIPSGFDVVYLTGTSITAKITIDWSYISDNKQYVTNTYSKGGFDERCKVQSSDSNNGVKLSLPPEITAVVGETLEIFYKGIILSNNPYNYNVEIICTKGNVYKNKYMFTPVLADVGNHSFSIYIYDDNKILLDYKQLNIKVVNKISSPLTEKNILCIGDSLTAGGEWVNEIYRRLTQSGGSPTGDSLTNINFLGTRRTVLNAGYEGYGGWTYSNYNTNTSTGNIVWVNVASHDKDSSDQHSIYLDSNNVPWKIETIEVNRIKMIRQVTSGTMPSSGILTWSSGGTHTSNIIYSSITLESGNPFWNDTTNQVDLLNYVQEQGKTTLDICYVLLGWNMTSYSENDFKNGTRTLINNIKTSFPNCKINLLGLQVPSLDGIGANYGTAWNWYNKTKFVFDLNSWYEELETEFTNVKFVNIASQFDTENNMQTSTRVLNTRNSNTEVYQNNGVHPANSGYMQIADVVYRNILTKLA